MVQACGRMGMVSALLLAVVACGGGSGSEGRGAGGSGGGGAGGAAGEGGGGGTGGTGGSIPLECSDPTPDLCGGTCTDVASDPKHCGGCGMACAQGETCGNGACFQVEQIALGAALTCALRGDGTVICWGYTSEQKTVVPNLDRVIQVATSTRHGCALKSDFTVWCWGYNFDGQAGVDRVKSTYVVNPVQIEDLPTAAEQVAVGDEHSCALLRNGEIACWGANDEGQLGAGDRMSWHIPRVVDLPPAKQVSAGAQHTCAVVDDDASPVRCWGTNEYGQVSGIRGTRYLEPSALELEGPVLSISAGAEHSCALVRRDGGTAVWCWGIPSRVILGNPTSKGEPGEAAGTAGATAVAAGGTHTCALFSGGAARCWGRTTEGQLGGGTIDPEDQPVEVIGVDSIEQIALGDRHACAKLRDGSLWCWGSNGSEQLGVGIPWTEIAPQPMRVIW